MEHAAPAALTGAVLLVLTVLRLVRGRQAANAGSKPLGIWGTLHAGLVTLTQHLVDLTVPPIKDLMTEFIKRFFDGWDPTIRQHDESWNDLDGSWRRTWTYLRGLDRNTVLVLLMTLSVGLLAVLRLATWLVYGRTLGSVMTVAVAVVLLASLSRILTPTRRLVRSERIRLTIAGTILIGWSTYQMLSQQRDASSMLWVGTGLLGIALVKAAVHGETGIGNRLIGSGGWLLIGVGLPFAFPDPPIFIQVTSIITAVVTTMTAATCWVPPLQPPTPQTVD